MPKKFESLLTLTVNAHTLTGKKSRGKWLFTCPSFPELEAIHKGAASAEGCIGDFTRLALAGSFTFTVEDGTP